MKPVVVLSLLVLAPWPAAGATSLSVLAVDNCSAELTSGSARVLRDALAKQLRPGDFKVKSEEETLAALGGPVRGSFKDAQRLYESAQVYFHEDFGSGAAFEVRSLKADDEATAILMSLSPSEPGRFKLLSEVASHRAQIYYLIDKAKAEKALEPILRVDSFFQVDQEKYSPDMWHITDKVRKKVKATANAALSVTTKPPGLSVYVDGREMGKSPVTVDLPPGAYRVEAAFGKERAMARTVTLKYAAALELDQSLDGAVRVGSGPCLATSGTREARLVSMMKLAAYLGVDQLVGVWQEEPAKDELYVVAAAVETKSGQQVREAKIKAIRGQVLVGDVEKLGQFITKGEAAPPVETVVTKPKPVPKELAAQDDAMTRDLGKARSGTGSSRAGWRTAAYVSGGVAIAAFGVGTYGLITSNKRQREQDSLKVNGVFPTDSLSRKDQLASQISTYKTVGIVGIATGVVAAGATVGFYLYSNSEPPSGKAKIGITPNGVYFAASF